MALKFNFENSQYGVGYPDAYARIEAFHGNKESITILVSVHANEKSRKTNQKKIADMGFTMPFYEITGELLPSMYFWLQQQKPFLNNSSSC